MFTINKFIILFPIILSGCGFFSKKVESIVEKEESKNNPVTKSLKKNLFCNNNKLQLVLEDGATIKFYDPLFSSLIDNTNYSFIQKSAIISLIEMLRRPDVASPTSRFQFFLRIKDKDYYYDFTSKNSLDSAPFMKGIDFLVKNFDETKTLNKLTEILDRSIPNLINVSPALENFIQLYRNDISKNEELVDYFFKGDEVLTRHESFKRQSIRKIFEQYINKKQNNDALYDITPFPLRELKTESPNLQLSCNLDINKEDPEKKDIHTTLAKNSHYFSIMEGNNIFIGVTSSIVPDNSITNIKGTYFIKTTPPLTPLPICKYKTKTQDIVLFSTKGRSPKQHLRHLINYDIELVDSQASLRELLIFSRHLFLNNPYRILYESKRGRKSQLDFFLSMNFPIYHVSSLGDITGSAIFKTPNGTSKSLIVDDRSSAQLRCSP